jgi:hypothetical protein
VASPGELVKRIAETFGAPEATVTLHDRNLADAGLRTKGGRGRSAAKMTALDVANLLVAVAGSSMVKNTVQTVEDYSGLPSRGGEMSVRKDAHSFSINGNPPSIWDLSAFPIQALQKLPAEHSFRDAIVALIEAAADGSLIEAVKNLPVEQIGKHRIGNHWRIEVILWGPYPQAAIRIYCKDFSEKHHYSAIPTDMDKIMEWSKEMEADRNHGDLQQIREFSSKTILAMGDLLKS